jgi:hypothetical protein
MLVGLLAMGSIEQFDSNRLVQGAVWTEDKRVSKDLQYNQQRRSAFGC